MQEEKIFDKEQWTKELAAVIEDVRNHVKTIFSSSLDATDEYIFFNVTTLEGDDYCIQMSKNGFVIVDHCHNSSSILSEDYFETPYALLDKVSPKYRQSFASKLINSLTALKENQVTDKSNLE